MTSWVKVTDKRVTHATGPLVNNVKLRRAGAAGVQVKFFASGQPSDIFSVYTILLYEY